MASANNSSIPYCNTYYKDSISLDNTQRSFLIGISVTATISILITSSLVLITLVKTKQLSNLALRLVFVLSTSDCCVAAVSCLLGTLLHAKYASHEYCGFHMATMYISYFFDHTSGYVIGLIGMDRFARIKYLNLYSQTMTRALTDKILVGILSSAIVESLLLGLAPLNIALIIIEVLDGIFFVGVITITLMTTRMIKRHRKDAANKALLEKVDHTVTQLGRLIVISLLVLYTPYLLTIPLSAFFSDEQWYKFYQYVAGVIAYYNCLANGLIFLYTNRKAKRWIKRVVGLSTDVKRKPSVKADKAAAIRRGLSRRQKSATQTYGSHDISEFVNDAIPYGNDDNSSEFVDDAMPNSNEDNSGFVNDPIPYGNHLTFVNDAIQINS